MSPEAQRIAIAGACGWKRSPFVATCYDWQRQSAISTCTDPLVDLNAMHAAIMSRSREERNGMLDVLFRLTQKHGKVDPIDQVNATAAQRAEAFLKTLNLWTD